MKSTLLRLSTAGLLVIGATSVQACASTGQYPYRYERHERYERRAFDNGVRDGYARGIDDVRHHRRADIDRQRWYRHGDRDYDRYSGTRDEYRMEYRRGFEEGYERAYREARHDDWREGWRR